MPLAGGQALLGERDEPGLQIRCAIRVILAYLIV